MGVVALIFSEPSQTVVAFVPNVGSVGKHRVAVSAEPIRVRDAAIAGCLKPLALTPRELPLCNTDSRPAVQAVGLAVLVRGAGPVSPPVRGEKAEDLFPIPKMDRKVQSSASRTSLL